MKTTTFLWRLIRFRPWLYYYTVFYITAFFMGRLVFGLIMQALFNLLPNQPHLSLELWLLILLQVVVAHVHDVGPVKTRDRAFDLLLRPYRGSIARNRFGPVAWRRLLRAGDPGHRKAEDRRQHGPGECFLKE